MKYNKIKHSHLLIDETFLRENKIELSILVRFRNIFLYIIKIMNDIMLGQLKIIMISTQIYQYTMKISLSS